MSRIAKPALSRVIPPGPSTDNRLLCVNSASGFVWSINWESGLDPKNSLIDDTRGFGLTKTFTLKYFCSQIPIRS